MREQAEGARSRGGDRTGTKPAAGAPDASLDARVLGLQRSVGNRAVAEVIRGATRDPVTRAAASGEDTTIPARVDAVLRSPGHPIEPGARAFLEAGFGRDFGDVRVHDDAEASASARELGARAFTVGRHVAFAAGAYRPSSRSGRRLLAHELAHTLQQRRAPVGDLRIGEARDGAEVEADRAAADVLAGRVPSVVVERAGVLQRERGDDDPIHRPLIDQYRRENGLPPGGVDEGGRSFGPTDAQIKYGGLLVPRPTGTSLPYGRALAVPGPNPAACIDCATLRRVPLSPAAIAAAADRWRDGTIACVSAAAAASNASHYADIVANEAVELAEEVTTLNTDIPPRERARRVSEYRENLVYACERKKSEIELEFRYNVVFVNDDPLRRWGRISGEFGQIDAALAAVPPEMLWANPVLIRFSRAYCHPSELAAGGVCGGQIGGETAYTRGDPSAGVTLFDAGMQQRTTYGRSARIGVAASDQSFRHEIGHVIMEQIPAAAVRELFDTLMDWHDEAYVRLQTTPSPYPEWAAARQRAMAASGQATDAAFDAWLRGLVIGTPVRLNGYELTRVRRFTTSDFLTWWRDGAVPRGVEFEYARTNQGDYFAEIYTLALSVPEWLHDRLPANQLRWLKERVFHTDVAEWSKQFAARDLPDEFWRRLTRVFTWQQARRLFESYLGRVRSGGVVV